MNTHLKKTNLTPQIRFPGFSSDWKLKELSKIVDRIADPVDVNDKTKYREIGIRSHGKGIFYKDPIDGKELGNKRVYWIKKDTFIVNIVFAWEHAIAKTTKNEVGMIASHRFPMYLPKESKLDLDFLLYFFLRKRGKYLLELASPGGAGRNKTLGQKSFGELQIAIPSVEEQRKISEFLSSVDLWIENLRQQKRLLEKYKKGMMQKIFLRKIRFKNESGHDFPIWEKTTLEKCLDYEQPQKYSVNDTEYDDSFNTPVLTAGKSFILGHTNETNGIYKNLPVIIFDDFTTAIQFVDFQFKVKSSAMKILKAKPNIDTKFIFELMKTIKYQTGGHGRHWISKYSKLGIELPHIDEQKRIGSFSSSIDQLIKSKDIEIKQAKKWKKGLFQKIFV